MNDKTDHGGIVISTSSGTVVMGLPAALEGDMTICPRCKGKFAIKTDKAGARHNGKHYAYHGDVAECGARLLTSIAWGSGVAAGSDQSIDSSSASVATGGRGSPGNAEFGFDDKFVLIDDETGAPLASKDYAIRRASGKIEFGVTDSKGMTHIVSSLPDAETIEIYF